MNSTIQTLLNRFVAGLLVSVTSCLTLPALVEAGTPGPASRPYSDEFSDQIALRLESPRWISVAYDFTGNGSYDFHENIYAEDLQNARTLSERRRKGEVIVWGDRAPNNDSPPPEPVPPPPTETAPPSSPPPDANGNAASPNETNNNHDAMNGNNDSPPPARPGGGSASNRPCNGNGNGGSSTPCEDNRITATPRLLTEREINGKVLEVRVVNLSDFEQPHNIAVIRTVSGDGIVEVDLGPTDQMVTVDLRAGDWIVVSGQFARFDGSQTMTADHIRTSRGDELDLAQNSPPPCVNPCANPACSPCVSPVCLQTTSANNERLNAARMQNVLYQNQAGGQMPPRQLERPVSTYASAYPRRLTPARQVTDVPQTAASVALTPPNLEQATEPVTLASSTRMLTPFGAPTQEWVGDVLDVRLLAIDGNEELHRIARVQTIAGHHVVMVDLGPAAKSGWIGLQPDQLIRVSGRPILIDGQPALLARHININGREGDIDHAPSSQRTFEGLVMESWTAKQNGEPHRIARMKMSNDRITLVDLGPEERFDNLHFSPGQNLFVRGRPGKVHNLPALLVDRFQLQGQVIDVPPSTTAERYVCR